METNIFENISHINEIQFLTDSTGYLLDENGILFHFSGNETQKISTPSNIHISNFHFITETEGAIIGHNNSKNIKQSSFFHIGFLILFLLLFIFIKKLLKHFKVNFFSQFLIVSLVFVGIVSACSNDWKKYVEQDPDSPFTKIITKSRLGTGFHNFGGNSGQISYFAKTTNSGKDWDKFKVPTNFNLTSILSIGDNYFVGTFADESHSDGDLWIYGNDSSYFNFLKQNDLNDPYFFSANRGISGMKYYDKDSTLILFGGELITKFPKNQNSSTEGNITELKSDLFANYKIIDIPGEVIVKSYSRLSNNEVYITTKNGELMKTNGKKWNDINIENHKNFKAIEFIPETLIGFTLTSNGLVYQTEDGGINWEEINTSGIEKLRVFNRSIIMIKENQVIRHNS